MGELGVSKNLVSGRFRVARLAVWAKRSDGGLCERRADSIIHNWD